MDTPARINLTTFSSPHILVKSYSQADDGTLKKVSPDRVGFGTAETLHIFPAQLPDVLQGLSTHQSLIHGTAGDGIRKIVPDRYRKGTQTSRTKKFFSYPDGPGLGMLDHDPESTGWTGSPDELRALICSLMPSFADAATVSKFSASANIYSGDTLLSTPSPGYHLYFFPLNAADLPRFGRVLFDRLVLAGKCYGKVSKNHGMLLKRGPVDAMVFSPERVDYSAPALMGKGLHQLPQRPVFTPG
ncbi:hypothetical protein JWG39_16010, partial [Desulforhopalus vacuolatus]